MLKTVAGIYQDGQVKLSELPQDIDAQSQQVLVTFLDPTKISLTKLRQMIEQLETLEGIQASLEQAEAGKTRPLGDFMQGMQHKYDISGLNDADCRS